MRSGVLNLFLMCFWAGLSVIILFRRSFLGEPVRADGNIDLLGYGALALAGWNAFRLYMIRRAKSNWEADAAAREREFQQQNAEDVKKSVTDPQLKFDDAPVTPPPETNGKLSNDA